MNVVEILQSHAERVPEMMALFDMRRGRARSMTFGEFNQAAARTATLLRTSGLVPGDTVLVFQKMSIELYVALGAIFRLGLTAMFVDPSAGRSYIDRCCRLRPPRALIASSRAHLLRLTTSSLRQIPIKFSIGPPVPGAVGIERAASLECDPTVQACSDEEPALVSFTSGTTGEPKLALRTHGFLLAQHRAISAALDLQPGEVELVALPIFVLSNLASRVTSVIPDADLRRPDAINPASLVAQISHHKISRASASPALFECIAEYCEYSSITLPTLEKVFTGGGPVSLRLLDRLQRVAPRARITVVYGSTEAEPISITSLDELNSADRTAMSSGQGLLAGQPVPSITLRIMKDRWGVPLRSISTSEFEHLMLPAKLPGEIIVSGEHVLGSYLDGQGNEENKLFVDGVCWHRTGDAGYLDEHRRLWLLGRCSARVDDDHGAVYPLGIEQAALRYDVIRRAAMVSVRGERVLAVELVGHSTKRSLDQSDLLRSLAFANIAAVRIVKQVPVDPRHNAKVNHPALTALLERSR